MKLLFLTEFFPTNEDSIAGGVEARAWYICQEICKKHQVTVITSRQPKQKKHNKINKNLEVYRPGPILNYSNKGNLKARTLHQIAAVKLGKKLTFDHVQGNSFLHYNTTWLLSKIKKKSSSITYHESWIGEWKKIKPGLTGILGELSERITAKLHFDHIISVSKTTQKQLKDKTGLKSVVIPNGTKIPSKITSKKKDYVVSVGRLVHTKRMDMIIKACKKLDLDLVIIGSGPELTELTKLAKHTKTEFFPKVSRKELEKKLSEARLFVSASELEGFGMIVIESAAFGTPYVVSNILPFVEVTKGGKGGYIFKNGNQKSLEMTLSKAYKSPVNEKELLELVKEYNWEKIAKIFLKTIK